MEQNIFVGINGSNVCLLRTIATFELLEKNACYLDERDFSDVDMSHWGNGLGVSATLSALGLKDTGKTIRLETTPLLLKNSKSDEEPIAFCITEIRAVTPTLLLSPLENRNRDVSSYFVIRAPKVTDKKDLITKYGYAMYDDYAGSFSSGCPCLSESMEHTIVFGTPETARDWYDSNHKYLEKWCRDKYDIDNVSIAKVETIISDVYTFATANQM